MEDPPGPSVRPPAPTAASPSCSLPVIPSPPVHHGDLIQKEKRDAQPWGVRLPQGCGRTRGRVCPCHQPEAEPEPRARSGGWVQGSRSGLTSVTSLTPVTPTAGGGRAPSHHCVLETPQTTPRIHPPAAPVLRLPSEGPLSRMSTRLLNAHLVPWAWGGAVR